MTKIKSVFSCGKCDYETQKWLGKCPRCDEWNSFTEVNLSSSISTLSSHFKVNDSLDAIKDLKKFSQIDVCCSEKYFTKNVEFDRILGGGITKDSVVLFGGEPGVGKSTLLLTVCRDLIKNYPIRKFLYISGEETSSQVRDRCQRIGIENDLGEHLYICHETSWQKILEILIYLKPDFLIIDSIQTIMSQDVQSSAGSPSQVREITSALVAYAKLNQVTIFVVGHVTKDGSLAGPKLLEHMVDTVLSFEGDSSSDNRELRPIKNRFGHTNQVGFFKISENGVAEVENIAETFLSDGNVETCGKVITCASYGNRSIFAEIQALVVENKFGVAKKTCYGIDLNRLALLVAIVEKFLELPIAMSDIYVNIAGGLKLKNPENDLAIIAALLSSVKGIVINKKCIFLGEVSLTGEVRSPTHVENLLKAIENYGYEKVITSLSVENKYAKVYKFKIFGISTIRELDSIVCGKKL